MGHQTEDLIILEENFRILYPLFKEEVFRRRTHMMALSALACTILVSILVFFPLVANTPLTESSYHWISITGVVLYSTLFFYFILQQAERHRMAKQQLIRLEQEAGFYLSHETPENAEPFYPQNWQTDWSSDKSVLIYLSCIGSLTFLVIAMIVTWG